LLNGIKASLKENGPTYYSVKLAPAPTKSVPNSYPSNRAAVGIKKPAKSKGIAQQSSKLFEILENLAQRIPEVQNKARYVGGDLVFGSGR
jgi:hypothetical protein